MATPEKRGKREHLSRTGLHRVYLASFLLAALCTGMALGEEVHQEIHHEARAWLEFNHHVGGIVVLILAGLTWLDMQGIRPDVVRLCWPSCLIFIGLYNLILSDRFTWPIGLSGLVVSFSSAEVLQHKALAIIVMMLGLIDLLRRMNKAIHTAWLYLFYGMAVLTGCILMMHDSGVMSHADAHGLMVSHVLMGLLALLALVLKVLIDYRIISGRIVHLYPLLLLGLGGQLLLFTDTSGIRH